VREPEIYVQTREAEREGAPVAVEHGATRNPLLQIFQPDLLGITLPATVMAIGAQGGYYAIFTWLPTFLKTSRHLSIVGSVPYLSVVILGSFLGYVISGYVNDWLGRKLTFMIFAICSAILIFLYTHIPAGANAILLALGLPLGFFASGILAGLALTWLSSFPVGHEARDRVLYTILVVA
jgi:predicted MFS family arabinose efflux permease